MKDHSLIENTWKKDLIRNSGLIKDHIISDENRHILEQVGLPIILNNLNYQLLPLTFLQTIELDDHSFYLLADIGITSKGTYFLGLKQSKQEIFEIYIHENQVSCLFLNQGLYQYLMCLAHYTSFLSTTYPLPSVESKKQVRNDYQKLVDNMKLIDSEAMQDPGCFWADQVSRIQVSGYDAYFSDFEYEDTKPLTPEEQKRIDNMDLPF